MSRRIIQNIKNILQAFSFVDTVDLVASGSPNVIPVCFRLDQALGGAIKTPVLEQKHC